MLLSLRQYEILEALEISRKHGFDGSGAPGLAKGDSPRLVLFQDCGWMTQVRRLTREVPTQHRCSIPSSDASCLRLPLEAPGGSGLRSFLASSQI